MNIGIFTDTYSPQVNGVVSSILTLEKQLLEKGHEVYIFTISHPKATDTKDYVFRSLSMPFVFLKDQRVGLLYSTKMVRKIKRLKLDIILSQTEFSLGLFAKMMSKRLHIPIIHTYHTMYEEYMHYISKGVEFSPELARKYSKKFCNSVDGVVAPTEKTKNLLLKYGVTTPIRIIPTGIDFSPFNKNSYSVREIQTLKSELNIPLDAPIILFIGRVAKEKSIDMILQALSLLVLQTPGVKFLIVGDGPERQNLTKLASELNLLNNIIFAGMQPWNNIGKFYQLGDIFVSASVSETQGLTFAEAMAASLPVVARRDESVQGLIKDNQNGKLFDTSEELAKILGGLLGNKAYQEELSTHALESIKPLSAEIFGENALTYYMEIKEIYSNNHKELTSKSPNKWTHSMHLNSRKKNKE